MIIFLLLTLSQACFHFRIFLSDLLYDLPKRSKQGIHLLICSNGDPQIIAYPLFLPMSDIDVIFF